MTRAAGSLERSLAAITIGVHQSVQERKRQLRDTATGECFQQVQVSLSGAATESWAFADRDVTWELPFLYAPAQRQVPFDRPHFAYGIEFSSGVSDLVVIHASVMRWLVTDEGWCLGANVRFSVGLPPVAAPGAPPASLRRADATRSVAYSAIAHLTFQGYATTAEGAEYQP